MRPLSRFAITALLALTWTSLASAESPDALDPSAFAAVTEMVLDDAFEKSTARSHDEFLRRLAGPTSMDCTSADSRNGLETCVVTTAENSTTSIPATRAQQ